MTDDKKCAICGTYINERYTYCRDCFYKLGSPKDTVVNKLIAVKFTFCLI